jgi:response regulator NasT
MLHPAGKAVSEALARLDSVQPERLMNYRETDHLRVLIANERKDRLALVAPIVIALGHEVIAREIEVEDVGAVTARERPDVALVGLGESSEHALDLITKIVREASCPVIVLLHARDPDFIKEASKRGVFAHISDADVEDWQSSIDITLRRFAEYHDLEGAFGRRALTERAKASSWSVTPSTRPAPSRCSASAHASTTANSSTSPPPSSTATACSPSSRSPRNADRPRYVVARGRP